MRTVLQQIEFCETQLKKKEYPVLRDILGSLQLLESCEVLPKELEEGQFQRFFTLWYEFRTEDLKSKPRMTPQQGVALQSIIKHLVRVSKDKSYDSAFKGWELILKNWKKLTPYLQKQVSLVQVNENLEEILVTIFNKKHHGQKNQGSIAPGSGNPGKDFGGL